MLSHPDIDPVAFELGPLQVHWYGLMYLVGFLLAWWLARWRTRRYGLDWTHNGIDDLVFWGAIGVIAGGRIGYIVFYQFETWLHDPWMLVRVWEGGMSFHGGLIGVILALFWLARRHGRPLLDVTDFVVPLVPLGLGAGRLGNFINGELWGRVTDVPWAMVFPGAGPQPRHPSQIYEFALEGVVLFVLLMWFAARPRPAGAVSGLFLLGYGVFRFLVEFAREPDRHLGTIAFDWLTMGQLLSLPMALGGAALMAWAYRRGD